MASISVIDQNENICAEAKILVFSETIKTLKSNLYNKFSFFK